ncbi:hypothetical protein CWI42_011740 [Ordospora colligata]|uniref:Uncharacterized protein n=1 Tax=Ordospora colligata OC4 TaxID=1354746 RepID=A0A0B2UMJ7_9MICR|nr:uncharacterized protein M896_011740 [Ordospora colligata OC4]KHN70519.1 hypothetical protein M896_011740 [Ordospora colligata OC4]TBU17269.1 hypothetical protein CWI41_011740 [Ordospora colligata]TBU17519.1 hypothetical protein CWI40_011740 [Ordospora colligata]TBU19699.1 hypothetical protein CWI42_011740 [Ordospora colligata]
MIKLYEGMSFIPKNIAGCTLIEIIHKNTFFILPGDIYHIPVGLDHQEIFTNIIIHTGTSSIMTVNYIETYSSNDRMGVLSYREFENVDATQQRILESQIYEIYPPFRIKEYFDGVFVCIKLECLADKSTFPEYIVFDGMHKRLQNCASVYKAYADESKNMFSIVAKAFIYRFVPMSVCGYLFRFKIWKDIETIHFIAYPTTDNELEIECIDQLKPSREEISIHITEFNLSGGFIRVNGCRIGVCHELDGNVK